MRPDLVGIFQLHWQRRDDPTQTEFVAQASAIELGSTDAVLEHFRSVIERRKEECPDGWMPMVCDAECDRFVTAKEPQP